MKPYLLVTGDFVKTGGMDRANYALADYLARLNVPVHLVAYRIDRELQNYSNVFWHQVPKIANSYFLSSFLLDAIGQFWARQIQAQGGRVLVNGGNCQWADVNWVHYVHAAYAAESRVDVLRQIKTRITHHHFRRAEQRNLDRAQCVIANSQQTYKDLVQHGLASVEKIHPVYYGVDASVFYPATSEVQRALRQKLGWLLDRPIVVFIGALGDRRKGFDALFAAWKELCADPTWDADLMVIGRGKELPLWKQRSQEANLENRIQFLGFRQDVPDLLRAADCLIAPTRYEAYGLGVHEALCCGLPALVSETAGIAERYPEALQALLLPTPVTSDAISLSLQHWRQAAQFYRQQVQNWSISLRQYSWDAMAQNLLATLEGVPT